MIEVVNYETGRQFKLLSEQMCTEKTNNEKTFWANAVKYAASKNDDKQFVSEMAYLMVTLHRTGT
jgi:hypothetical protein